VAALWEHPARTAALARLDLLDRVVKQEQVFRIELGELRNCKTRHHEPTFWREFVCDFITGGSGFPP